jgi:hypothetical protein
MHRGVAKCTDRHQKVPGGERGSGVANPVAQQEIASLAHEPSSLQAAPTTHAAPTSTAVTPISSDRSNGDTRSAPSAAQSTTKPMMVAKQAPMLRGRKCYDLSSWPCLSSWRLPTHSFSEPVPRTRRFRRTQMGDAARALPHLDHRCAFARLARSSNRRGIRGRHGHACFSSHEGNERPDQSHGFFHRRSRGWFHVMASDVVAAVA